MKNHYLLVLGRNPTLSRAEIATRATEVLYDKSVNLSLVKDLQFFNPRNLPKSDAQLFLDRIGGVIRIAEVIGEFSSKSELIETITEHFPRKNSGTLYVGVSSFGTGKTFLPEFLKSVRKSLETTFGQTVRVENPGGENLDSGRIFGSKLLKKGAEFLVWQRGNTFLLGRTVATQNLRNYTLRDRAKGFRDAHMGMLPPKLAQMLINFAIGSDFKNTKPTLIDPFCGSGTVNTEAAILGYQSIGSDIDPERISGAKSNFAFLGQKFRYEENSAEFFAHAAETFPWEKHGPGIIVTEGWLGENFRRPPTQNQIQKNATLVMKMWEKFFTHLKKSAEKFPRIALCIPAWEQDKRVVSIAEKLFAKARECGYAPSALFDGQTSCRYAREGAYVAREIVVLSRI